MADNNTAASAEQKKTVCTYRPKGFFRTLKALSAQTSEVCANSLSAIIFEQRRELLRDRTVGDAQWVSQLESDAEEFGGLESCKAAHNKLVSLLEELQI